jgi:xylulokinase/glycerol kinase
VKYIIALDIGTSSTRTALYAHDGRIECSFGREYHSVFPKPGHVEQDPASWKNAAVEVLSKLSAFMREKNYKAEGIAVTSQRSSLIPMDADGNAVTRAIMWQDKRTIEQCERLKADYGMENLYRKTGLRVNPYFVLPKILWLRENEAGLFNKMSMAAGVQDYVVYCLTGEYVTDWTQAGRTMLMNIEKFQWEDDLLRIAGISSGQLPRLVPPGAVAGPLTKEFAALCGLPSGLPVALSGGDQQNAAVALGVTRAGIAEANTGTGSFVLSYADKPVFDASCRVLVQPSAIAGKWVMEAGIFNTGAIYRWFKEQYCRDLLDNPRSYIIMDREAEDAGVGANGVMMLPHFEGSAAPYWNPIAKGLFFNLSLGTTRGDMNRAILEGIAMEIHDCLALIQELSGPLSAVDVAGGMTKSDLFCKIQADCYGLPVARCTNSEASSLGACIVAAPELGVHDILEQSYAAMASDVDSLFQPDSARHALYKEKIKIKKRLYFSLAENGVYESFTGVSNE